MAMRNAHVSVIQPGVYYMLECDAGWHTHIGLDEFVDQPDMRWAFRWSCPGGIYIFLRRHPELRGKYHIVQMDNGTLRRSDGYKRNSRTVQKK